MSYLEMGPLADNYVIRLRWEHASGALMRGLVPVSEETPGSFICLSLSSLCPVSAEWEGSYACKPGQELSQNLTMQAPWSGIQPPEL